MIKNNLNIQINKWGKLMIGWIEIEEGRKFWNY